MSTTIFPGMDPYLEHPLGWPSIHSRLVVYAADQLQGVLGQRYVTSVEQRVYLEGAERDIVPDVALAASLGGSDSNWRQKRWSSQPVSGGQPVLLEADELAITETYVSILDRNTNLRVVTVIEVLSPTNKAPGAGRKSYLQKQDEVLHSDAHLVEIDLLRGGLHTVAAPPSKTSSYRHDSLVSVNRAAAPRKQFEVYFLQLRDVLPTIRIPLAEGDTDAMLNLQALLTQTYDVGYYRNHLRYDQPCVPPLSEADAIWAKELISSAMARPGTAGS